MLPSVSDKLLDLPIQEWLLFAPPVFSWWCSHVFALFCRIFFFWIFREILISIMGKVFLAIIYIQHFKSSYNNEGFKFFSTAIMAVFLVLIVTLCVWMWKEFRINLNSLKLYIALCLYLHSYFLFFPVERVQRFH